MATVNADGTLISTFMTGPFGETLPNQTTPQNATTDTSYGYVGTHQKMTESSLTITPIQMGARVYIPGLGRFLQVDPVEGGTSNSYVYVTDPVNQFDLNGKWAFAIPFVMSFFTAIVAMAPVVIAVAIVVVVVATTAAVVNIYNNERARAPAATGTKTIATTKTATVPTTRKNCAASGYTPAPGRVIVQPKTANAARVNPQVSAGVGAIISSLGLGIKPGSVQNSSLGNNLYSPLGGWAKYEFRPGMANAQSKEYDFHYNVTDVGCFYADIKEKRSEEGYAW